MNCSFCGKSAPPQAEFCPQCLGQLPTKPESMAVQTLSPSHPEVAGLPLVAEDGPMCSEHPRIPASICGPCGAFYCKRCLPTGARPGLCLRCNTAQAVREAPEQLRRLFRELWFTPLIMGMAVALLFTLLGLASTTSQEVMGIALVGTVASTPFLLLALIIALTRSTAMAWLSFVIELMVLLVILLGELTMVSVVFLALAALIPLMTMFQIFKIKELQALQRMHPAGGAPARAAERSGPAR